MIDTVLILIGVVIGARFAAHINPLIDAVVAKVKGAFAGS